MLESATENAYYPQLAVTANGEAIAGWFSGEPPGLVGGGTAQADRARTAASIGGPVVVDRGSVTGGFEAPVVLSSHGSADVRVAVSGSGVAYAVWSEVPGEAVMVATASPGQPFSAPHPLLPPNTKLLGLVQSTDGPVAAAWVTSNPSSLTSRVLHYALLDANGDLGRTVTVGPMRLVGPGVSVALNDHGTFAAVGVTQFPVAVPLAGAQPSRPVVAVCDAAGQCSQQVLMLGRVPVTDDMQDAVALSDDGTVAVLAAYGGALVKPGQSRSLGLWAEVRRPNGHWLRAQEVSRTAATNPLLATADGRHEDLTVFTNEANGMETGLEWSRLPTSETRFAKAHVVGGPRASTEPTVAADGAGNFVIAWRSDTTIPQVAVATGEGDRVAGVRLIAPDSQIPFEVDTGIDGGGDALVIWSGWRENRPQGVFAAFYRP